MLCLVTVCMQPLKASAQSNAPCPSDSALKRVLVAAEAAKLLRSDLVDEKEKNHLLQARLEARDRIIDLMQAREATFEGQRLNQGLIVSKLEAKVGVLEQDNKYLTRQVRRANRKVTVISLMGIAATAVVFLMK
jgi:hypothetical protein